MRRISRSASPANRSVSWLATPARCNALHPLSFASLTQHHLAHRHDKENGSSNNNTEDRA
eukprot:3552645-Rhodomonas_salina.3